MINKTYNTVDVNIDFVRLVLLNETYLNNNESIVTKVISRYDVNFLRYKSYEYINDI